MTMTFIFTIDTQDMVMRWAFFVSAWCPYNYEPIVLKSHMLNLYPSCILKTGRRKKPRYNYEGD